MNRQLRSISSRPRIFGAICLSLAVVLGVCHITNGGGPSHYIYVNIAALLGAILILATISVSRESARLSFLYVAALLLLTTTFFGVETGGGSRWIRLGPLLLQPAMLLLPAMLCLFAGKPDNLGLFAIAIAALALALQPDRSMTGTMLFATTALLVIKRQWPVISASIISAAAFAVSLAQPDDLPAILFVEGVYQSVFKTHFLFGLLCICASAILPLALLSRNNNIALSSAFTFAATWAGVMLFAVAGNYPVPFIGYGASAILGYALSIAATAKRGAAHD